MERRWSHAKAISHRVQFSGIFLMKCSSTTRRSICLNFSVGNVNDFGRRSCGTRRLWRRQWPDQRRLLLESIDCWCGLHHIAVTLRERIVCGCIEWLSEHTKQCWWWWTDVMMVISFCPLGRSYAVYGFMVHTYSRSTLFFYFIVDRRSVRVLPVWMALLA